MDVDPEIGGDRGDRARSGEIGNLPKILPRFAEIEIRSDLKSSDFCILELLSFGKFMVISKLDS